MENAEKKLVDANFLRLRTVEIGWLMVLWLQGLW